ncbi:MAG: hypothetical protein AAFX58_00320 [Pseudomonadota bacterium]
MLLAGVALLALAGLAACDAEPERDFHGYLYFGAGNYLGELSLASGDTAPAASLGDRRIEQISPLRDGNFLLSITEAEPGRAQHRIVRFHPVRRNPITLLVGSGGQYFASSDRIVYDDGTALVSVPRARIQSAPTVIHEHAWRAAAAQVRMADDGLLFQPANGTIRYLPADGDVPEPLAALSRMCRLDDAVWIGTRSRLLCRAPGAADRPAPYRLVSLDGATEQSVPLPEDRDLRAVTYLADQDVLILNESSTGWFSGRETYSVWAYDLDTGQLHAIARNQYLGNSAVYRRRNR